MRPLLREETVNVYSCASHFCVATQEGYSLCLYSHRFSAAAALCCEPNRRYSSVHSVRVYYTGFQADVNVRVLCFGRKRRTANVCLTEHFLLTRTFVFYEIFSETYTIRSNICPSFTIAAAFPFIMYYCKKRNQYRFRPLVTLT